jgi:hypothetical protein
VRCGVDIQTLEAEFQKASKTEEFAVHNEFTRHLLACDSPDILQHHFELLRSTSNRKLYQRIRAAFVRRGDAVKRFLIEKIELETDSRLIGDAIQIFGHLRAKEVIPLVRGHLSDTDDYLRYNAIIVLGWMGTEKDVDLLGSRLKVEIDSTLRGYVATALRQVFLRLPETQERCLGYLKEAIEIERVDSALELMIISAQTISRKYFGLRENIDQGRITGDVKNAKAKALNFLLQ